MSRKITLSLCLCLSTIYILAQDEISIGESYHIYSTNLSDSIALQVYLPDQYEDTDQEFPTLYVLDGQWFFSNGVAIQESLRGNRIMPKMIVVGIDMVDRPYRSNLFSQWEQFISFIETELISFVEKSFKASSERAIFGWENSGILVSELILQSESPFQCAIVSNGAYVSKELIDLLHLNSDRYFFIGGSKKDIYSIDDTDLAAHTLEANPKNNLRWEYRLFNDEVHETLAYTSLYTGLRFFYHNYSSLVFGSIDEFNKQGGIPFLEEYFRGRGERFGMSTEIDASTKNSLIWLSWKRDQFDAFDQFMTEFDDVLSTKRYANAYWQNRLGQYYLKNKSYDKAISFFSRGITEYMDQDYGVEMHLGIARAYLGNGNREFAKRYMRKAIEIAKLKDDPKLKAYMEELKNI